MTSIDPFVSIAGGQKPDGDCQHPLNLRTVTEGAGGKFCHIDIFDKRKILQHDWVR